MAIDDVRIVGISGIAHNYPELISHSLCENGLRCSTQTIPFFHVNDFTPSVLRRVRYELNQASEAPVTIFCSGSAEIYVPGPHLSVHFSAYRSWFRPQRTRVIAHHWTDAVPPSINLSWSTKPPLSVGFMGTAYKNSRVGRILSKSVVKGFVLKGHHLRSPRIVAALNAARLPLRYAMTFPRAETLCAVQADAQRSGMDVRIVDTGGFDGSADLRAQYQRQMCDLTYVLCPRGIENYSYRFYESLKFGRVPVLIDTDMVLPDEVNWNELIVRVPYAQLADIGNFIRRDYESNSAAFFKERQEKAFLAMARLAAGGWVQGLTKDVEHQIAKKGRKTA